MIQLSGENLGKRQRELNLLVLETVKQKKDFNVLKESQDNSDIERLFKINVASKLRNVDYIVETLKCGDSLYVSRALDCDWFYKDEFSYLVNPDYLHHEIFPHMSKKMKTKFINKIATEIEDESRAQHFFTYFNNLKMNHLAQKFLYVSSESFKLDIINSKFDFLNIDCNLKKIIGTSFLLAEAFLSRIEVDTVKEHHLMNLSYLYSINNEKYLNLLEIFFTTNGRKLIGGRMSKSIMTKHKTRVLNSPLLYINKLNKYILVHHSTREDAKKYLVAVMPTTVEKFWNTNIYGKYKHLFNLIPKNESFDFLKNLFKSLYGDKPFEMAIGFYDYHYYELLSIDNQEKWALQHIEEGKEIFGCNKDFIWYKFVKHEQAFKAIKQLILVTSDGDYRNEMILILLQSCRNQADLENLFTYYYDRFVNEQVYQKENFVLNAVEKHNVFEFNKSCWIPFNKILYSIDVYTTDYFNRDYYRLFCTIYHIIHQMELPESLTYYLDNNINVYELKKYSKNLTNEQWNSVFNFLFEYFFNNFKLIKIENHMERQEVKKNYALKILNLFICYKKTKHELPKAVLEFVEERMGHFQHLKSFLELEDLTEVSLIKILKQDKNLLVKKLPEIKEQLKLKHLKLNSLLKKIKIYFPNDIAEDFLHFFNECIKTNSINNDWTTEVAVFGVFILGHEESKKELLLKYVPESIKIDRSSIDEKLLLIQKSICKFACYSRPPVLLNDILKYIKGDYVRYCCPMFKTYSSNLTLPQSLEFIKAILNTPLSIQKHGIRLAFEAYSTDEIKSLLTGIWGKTKNVSLRQVIYNALVSRLNGSSNIEQDDLFENLNNLTLTLCADDQDNIFDLIVSNHIPERFRGKLLESSWISTNLFLGKSKKKVTLIKIKLIKRIKSCIDVFDRNVCANIIEEHVENMFEKETQKNVDSLEETLIFTIWELTAAYIINCKNNDDFVIAQKLVTRIFKETFNQWKFIFQNNHSPVRFCYNFIRQVKSESCNSDQKENIYVVPLMAHILSLFEEFCYPSDVFLLVLDLKLYIDVRKIMCESNLTVEKASHLIFYSLVGLISSLVEKNQFLLSMLAQISALVTNNIGYLALSFNFNQDMLLAYVCDKLVTNYCKESALLGIYVMPLDTSTEAQKEFKEMLSGFKEKVTAMNDFEIQCNYFKKFINL